VDRSLHESIEGPEEGRVDLEDRQCHPHDRCEFSDCRLIVPVFLPRQGCHVCASLVRARAMWSSS
jgi:hypothetical protein